MKLNFTLSEFCLDAKKVPVLVADKLLKYHILPMQPIRNRLNLSITASQKSGYRSRAHELNRGRSGNSQHTFGEKADGSFSDNAKGAVDWTCSDLDALEFELINNSNYTRIARYKNFIHCDYKATRSGKRELYSSDSKSNWTFKKFIP